MRINRGEKKTASSRHLPFSLTWLFRNREMGLWTLVVGLAGGLFGVMYLTLLRAMTNWLGPESWSRPAHVLILMAVGLVAALIIAIVGNPGGIELLVDNIHVNGGWRDVRSLRSLLPVSLLCIAAGGASGPEAPLVQANGCIGSVLGYRLGLSPSKLRILTITGMASGFSVLFGAPLGAAVFALEFLHREGMEYYEAIIPATWGALIGYFSYVLLVGGDLAPVWEFPTSLPIRPSDFLWAIAVGVISAGVATAFAWLIQGLRLLFLRLWLPFRLCLGGAILGGLSFISAYALTFGEYQLMDIVTAPNVTTFFLLAAVAKFLGTSFTVASGWRGGFIIPLFFIGASLGRFVGSIFPGANEVVLMTAMMAGINAGVTKTPIGSTLVVTRMAHLSVIPTTLLSALISMSLSKSVGMIRSQRKRREMIAEN